MKKFLPILISVILATTGIQTSFATTVLPHPFTDLPANHLNYDAIVYLYNQGIIKGFDDKTVRPDEEITRVAFLKVVGLVAGIQETSAEDLAKQDPSLVHFTDTEENSWYWGILNEMVVRKVVKGYDNKEFRPGNSLNLVEALQMIYNAKQVDTKTYVKAHFSSTAIKEDPYADAFAGLWYTSNVQYSKFRNLLTVNLDKKVYPDKKTTRGELAEIMYRLVMVEENNLDKFDVSANWGEITTDKFSIKLARGWEFNELQGIDSYVGNFQDSSDPKTQLSFDYGWYSNSLAQDGDKDHILVYETIDGKNAKLVVPKSGNGMTGVYIDVDGQNKLSIYGENLSYKEQLKALEMFRTIKFTAEDHAMEMTQLPAEEPELVVEETVPPTPVLIDITNFAYNQANLQIKSGTTVTWTNKDTTSHTVTSDVGTELQSGTLEFNQTFTHTFTTEGTFAYHCNPHPFMKGIVTVTK